MPTPYYSNWQLKRKGITYTLMFGRTLAHPELVRESSSLLGGGGGSQIINAKGMIEDHYFQPKMKRLIQARTISGDQTH